MRRAPKHVVRTQESVRRPRVDKPYRSRWPNPSTLAIGLHPLPWLPVSTNSSSPVPPDAGSVTTGLLAKIEALATGGRSTNLKLLRGKSGMALTHATSALAARGQRHLFAHVEAFCLFVGHARSGSTLVGSLLGAHPEVVIAHELDVLRFVQWHYGRDQIYSLILRRDAEFHSRGRRHGSNGYDYAVSDSWQGRFTQIRVLGDKKAGATTRKLAERPELLDRLRTKVGVPLRLIQITRNPFDNIASVSTHGKSLADAADRYFARCATLAKVAADAGSGEMVVVRHEDLVADPGGALSRLWRFLGVTPEPAEVTRCAAVVNETPNRRSTEAHWTPELISSICDRMAYFDFLKGYGYDGPDFNFNAENRSTAGPL